MQQGISLKASTGALPSSRMERLLLLCLSIRSATVVSAASLRRDGPALRVQRLGAGYELHSIKEKLPKAWAPPSFVQKPVRIARGGNKQGDEDLAPHLDHEALHGCFETEKVDSKSDRWEPCPEACPFHVQDRTDTDFCTFACVTADRCRDYHALTPIADEELGVCRGCMVEACEVCDYNVTTDRCAKCQAGYYLSDGECYFKYGGAWTWVVLTIILVLVGLVALWVADMLIRPTSNEAGLQRGMEYRERIKVRQPADEDGERHLWPVTTNLCRNLVAGPGLILHFNFQLALIIWALWIAFVWIFFCLFVDQELWVMGTKAFGTPRMNCILVFEGYENHMRLMWVKVRFLWIAYFSSFLLCMVYGVWQLRCFQEVDYANKTFKDYVAMAVGLPAIAGSKPVEEELKQKVESVTGQRVVGVSVAWNYQDQEEGVLKALNWELHQLEPAEGVCTDPPELGTIRQKLYEMEQAAFCLVGGDEDAAAHESATKVLLDSMETSSRAFIVFETEEGRDEAVKRVQEAGGFEYETAQGIILETCEAEPDTVYWVNFSHAPAAAQAAKLATGFGIIALACLFWGVVFYAPYAYYVLTFDYQNGRSPGFIVGFSFSMIVVIGNAIMYEVCARISDWVGFRFKDQREACYMVLYTIACLFNVMLDFVVTYNTAEKVVEGLGFRTYFGIPLDQIKTFTAKFESYGMQRILAENTFGYAWPSTFLIPFLIEPFITVTVPLYLGKTIVRLHPEVQGRDAEQWVHPIPMDLGRYADLLLNCILAILIFYFPGGYTWRLFLGMAFAHCYIYAFDHWKVLRGIPACIFASFDVEFCAQVMMAPIVAIIASCIAYRTNCIKGYHCINPWTQGHWMIVLTTGVFILHTVLHIVCLTCVVPLFGRKPPESNGVEVLYKDIARRQPCTWFSSNPIHCLRSKFKYRHEPACGFYVLGEERTLKVNPTIGCFYNGEGSPKSQGSPKSLPA